MKEVTGPIEALGHVWTFSANSDVAALLRQQLINRCYELLGSLTKPAEKAVIYKLCFGDGFIYPDIVSSAASLDHATITEGMTREEISALVERNDAGEKLLIDLIFNPLAWVSLVANDWLDNNGEDVRRLWAAALSVNPQYNQGQGEAQPGLLGAAF